MSSESSELAEPLIAAAEMPAWGGLRHLALNIDYAIGIFSEAVGAALVLAKTCILFAGAVSRCVFNKPMWTAMESLSGDSRRVGIDRFRARDPASGRAISRGPKIDRTDHTLDLRRLSCRCDPGRRHADCSYCPAAPARNDVAALGLVVVAWWRSRNADTAAVSARRSRRWRAPL